jgi:hypothetical protein
MRETKREAELLELMRTDRTILNQREARQATIDANTIEERERRADRDRKRRRAAAARARAGVVGEDVGTATRTSAGPWAKRPKLGLGKIRRDGPVS